MSVGRHGKDYAFMKPSNMYTTISQANWHYLMILVTKICEVTLGYWNVIQCNTYVV